MNVHRNPGPRHTRHVGSVHLLTAYMLGRKQRSRRPSGPDRLHGTRWSNAVDSWTHKHIQQCD
ncbi:hypothetical protein OF83DRAFT_440536 [Amylostereum chailletii]|nr:hypothetical protein OF83DRAFT_440536 [Amylostereum chailletii]